MTSHRSKRLQGRRSKHNTAIGSTLPGSAAIMDAPTRDRRHRKGGSNGGEPGGEAGSDPRCACPGARGLRPATLHARWGRRGPNRMGGARVAGGLRHRRGQGDPAQWGGQRGDPFARAAQERGRHLDAGHRRRCVPRPADPADRDGQGRPRSRGGRRLDARRRRARRLARVRQHAGTQDQRHARLEAARGRAGRAAGGGGDLFRAAAPRAGRRVGGRLRPRGRLAERQDDRPSDAAHGSNPPLRQGLPPRPINAGFEEGAPTASP
jgi:hypothetical protein